MNIAGVEEEEDVQTRTSSPVPSRRCLIDILFTDSDTSIEIPSLPRCPPRHYCDVTGLEVGVPRLFHRRYAEYE